METLPQLRTERLLLSPLTAADIPRIVEYASNKKVAEYTLSIPHPYQEQDAIFWINQAHQGLREGTHYIFAIRDHETEALLGGIGLTVNKHANRAELGYWIGEPFWGRGLPTEATGGILRFGFKELKLRKIIAHHMTINPGSGKVMRNNGMRQEGLLRREAQRDGVEYDVALYGILPEEV